MADEQAQTEAPVVEETQPESPEQSENASEGDITPQERTGSTDRGDITEALRQEREARRALEARLNDPTFIYQQARQLGLTEEEAQDMAQEIPPQAAAPSDDYAKYQYFKELDKSREKYPELADDEDAQLAVTALMQAKHLSPLAAADRYFSKFQKVTAEAKAEGMKEKETVITDKEKAQTVTSTSTTDSEAAEEEELIRRSRDYRNGPKEAEQAQLELIKFRLSRNKR